MTKKNLSILKYAVPILALLIILIQLVVTNTTNLTKWKGGGFGMYAEVHCYYNEVYIKHMELSWDSLRSLDFTLNKAVRKAKCLPTSSNLENIAKLVSKYTSNDSITVQVWKPLIDAKNNSYSRELMNEFQLIKP